MFSLGLVLLELGLLLSIQNVYEKAKNRFSHFSLQKFIEKFTVKYNPRSILSQVLVLMLETDEEARPDFITLSHRLPNYNEVEKYYSSINSASNQVSRANRLPALDLEDPKLSGMPKLNAAKIQEAASAAPVSRNKMDHLSPPRAIQKTSQLLPEQVQVKSGLSTMPFQPTEHQYAPLQLKDNNSNFKEQPASAALNLASSKSVPYFMPSQTAVTSKPSLPQSPDLRRSKLFGEVSSSIPSTEILEDHTKQQIKSSNPFIKNQEAAPNMSLRSG